MGWSYTPYTTPLPKEVCSGHLLQFAVVEVEAEECHGHHNPATRHDPNDKIRRAFHLNDFEPKLTTGYWDLVPVPSDQRATRTVEPQVSLTGKVEAHVPHFSLFK